GQKGKSGDVELACRHQRAARRERAEQLRCRQRLPFLERCGGQPPKDMSVVVEDARGSIAERSRLGRDLTHATWGGPQAWNRTSGTDPGTVASRASRSPQRPRR